MQARGVQLVIPQFFKSLAPLKAIYPFRSAPILSIDIRPGVEQKHVGPTPTGPLRSSAARCKLVQRAFFTGYERAVGSISRIHSPTPPICDHAIVARR